MMKVSNDEWEGMMRVNLRGPYLAIRYAEPHMMRQRAGSIINITSRAAGFIRKGDGGHDRQLVYGVTKAGLERLSFFMSEELKPFGIAVNALSPGAVATDTALVASPNFKDMGAKDPTPEVLGPALLYLAQQTSETLTGQILHTDNFGKS